MRTNQLDILVEHWRANLPSTFGRSAIDQLFPGIITSKTLANLDSLGLGPRNRYIQGRKVFYLRDDFIDFLVKRTKRIDK